MPMYACPSDIGLQRNEWPIRTWARIRGNYVANAGNTCYGQFDIGDNPFLGAPFGPRDPTPLREITDGTSNTLLMSEIKVVPESIEWGGPMSDIQTALGGHVFTGWNAPNSGQDLVARLIPPLEDLASNNIPPPCRVPCGVPYEIPRDRVDRRRCRPWSRAATIPAASIPRAATDQWLSCQTTSTNSCGAR